MVVVMILTAVIAKTVAKTTAVTLKRLMQMSMHSQISQWSQSQSWCISAAVNNTENSKEKTMRRHRIFLVMAASLVTVLARSVENGPYRID